MEIVSNVRESTRAKRCRSNSFECDSLAMDALLGLSAVANASVALQSATSGTHLEIGDANIRLDGPQPGSAPKQAFQVYAPLRVVPADDLERGFTQFVLDLDEHLDSRTERLLRLLDQQQSWYDGQQRAASAAEQYLSLCEHQQQQWLHLNQQSPQVPATSQH